MVNGYEKTVTFLRFLTKHHDLLIIIMKTLYGDANGDPKRTQHC